MSRKPRYKIQRQNTYDRNDLHRYGRKQWISVYSDAGELGYALTREEADELYWRMTADYPCTYRIMEKR